MFSKRWLKRSLLITLAFVQAACSSTRIIRDDEYHTSQKYFEDKSFSAAEDAFPRKEKNGFITTLEKNWIRLWERRAKVDELKKISNELDDRKVVKISQEATAFFLRETEEGYFPSEHEVIVLYLVTAMAYLDLNDFKAARVEVKKAAEAFQRNYNEKEVIFDDPALRLWLASLWIAVGEWSEAQVDLRRIFELTKNKEALRLSELEKPPADWNLNFVGSGVLIHWQEETIQPEFLIKTAPIQTSALQFSSENWYAWHLKRNNAFRERLLESNYMAQYVGIKSRSTAVKTMGYTAGGAVIATGVLIGTAIVAGTIYALSQSKTNSASSGDAVAGVFGLAALITVGLAEKGMSVIKETDKQVKEDEELDFKKMQTYRTVRFLPQRIGISSVPLASSSDQKIYRFPNYSSRVVISLDPY